MHVIIAKSDHDTWAIGPFENSRFARELMLVLDAKYGETIEYEVQELIEPSDYDDDVLEVANATA